MLPCFLRHSHCQLLDFINKNKKQPPGRQNPFPAPTKYGMRGEGKKFLPPDRCRLTPRTGLTSNFQHIAAILCRTPKHDISSTSTWMPFMHRWNCWTIPTCGANPLSLGDLPIAAWYRPPHTKPANSGCTQPCPSPWPKSFVPMGFFCRSA